MRSGDIATSHLGEAIVEDYLEMRSYTRTSATLFARPLYLEKNGTRVRAHEPHQPPPALHSRASSLPRVARRMRETVGYAKVNACFCATCHMANLVVRK